jgi:fibronectin-binding autotransporter adhesin
MRRRMATRALGVAAIAVIGFGSGSALGTGPVAVDCGQGADLQAAINSAKPGAVLAISGTCVGTFTVAKNLTLKGVSAAVIDARAPRNSPPGNAALAVSGGTVTVKKLTITGANTDAADGFDPGGALTNSATLHLDQVTLTGNIGEAVGGIWNSGTLTMTRSVLTANDGQESVGGLLNTGTATIDKSSISENRNGVGIQNGWLGAPGTLTLSNSTVSGNRVMPVGGAGIRNETGDVTIVASTIANNTAGNESPGGIANGGTMTITRSTITGNEGDALSGISPGSRMTITASILSDNLFDNQPSNCAARFTSGGDNLLGSDCADSAVATDVVSDAPNLKPLAAAGGPTKTMVPRPASPAVDVIPIGAGPCAATGTTDQRGLARPRGTGCEIGSVERQPTG